jgi:hypothetical protein
MKNGVFWDVTPCGSYKNRRFGGTWRLLHQGDKNRWTRNNTNCNQQPTYGTKKTPFFIVTAVKTSILTTLIMHVAQPMFQLTVYFMCLYVCGCENISFCSLNAQAPEVGRKLYNSKLITQPKIIWCTECRVLNRSAGILWRFGGTYCSLLPSKVMRPSEVSKCLWTTKRYTPYYGTLHSDRCENLKFDKQ